MLLLSACSSPAPVELTEPTPATPIPTLPTPVDAGGPVVITEVMVSPVNGEAVWIELTSVGTPADLAQLALDVERRSFALRRQRRRRSVQRRA